jgi:hypothetical protein
VNGARSESNASGDSEDGSAAVALESGDPDMRVVRAGSVGAVRFGRFEKPIENNAVNVQIRFQYTGHPRVAHNRAQANDDPMAGGFRGGAAWIERSGGPCT